MMLAGIAAFLHVTLVLPLINLALIMVVMLLLWRIAVRIGDVSFIDAVWAYGMVLLAWVSALHAPYGLHSHAWALLALVSLWGMRLGTHLLIRWRRSGPDPRYTRILGGAMKRRGWSFSTAALLIVFMLQGPLLWFISLPAQIGILTDIAYPWGAAGVAGAALALGGIALETVADAQLAAFRADPARRGGVLDTGLWRYTRHPNYFGEACTWWGLWLVASETALGVWTLPAPLLITWMLMRWSGAPILEKSLSASKSGYADYIRRTSPFVPWPPRR